MFASSGNYAPWIRFTRPETLGYDPDDNPELEMMLTLEVVVHF